MQSSSVVYAWIFCNTCSGALKNSTPHRSHPGCWKSAKWDPFIIVIYSLKKSRLESPICIFAYQRETWAKPPQDLMFLKSEINRFGQCWRRFHDGYQLLKRKREMSPRLVDTTLEPYPRPMTKMSNNANAKHTIGTHFTDGNGLTCFAKNNARDRIMIKSTARQFSSMFNN